MELGYMMLKVALGILGSIVAFQFVVFAHAYGYEKVKEKSDRARKEEEELGFIF